MSENKTEYADNRYLLRLMVLLAVAALVLLFGGGIRSWMVMADVQAETAVVDSAASESGLLTISTTDGDVLQFKTYRSGGPSPYVFPKPYRETPPAPGSVVTYKLHPGGDVSQNELIRIESPE